MTKLIRCRGALSEIAKHFSARPSGALKWTPTIWPGENVLVAINAASGPQIELAQWSLPASCFNSAEPADRRSNLFARDLVPGAGRLLDADGLARCLLIVEDVAYPSRDRGGVTRTWVGAWDEPYLAWAGVCTGSAGQLHCASLLVPATGLVTQAAGNMPYFLPRASWASWLAGEPGHAMPARFEEQAYYLEPSDEDWSSGRTPDDLGENGRARV
ncbi:hypothetical protein [Novosphingobium pokkalii]|uniref:DUF159 family protein n=1 Tax=Novosphingobium pokkalii TaxID=1770194 RepID=A0ABV7UY16_9SPHN|nr:hypothetical protein [Novosphingobium pokkalii]GHC96834.1 hypothetical protein GCM10019060_27070 [Novosphingobium pokkalii]